MKDWLQFLLCLVVIYLVIKFIIWKWNLLFRFLRHPGRASFWNILLLLLFLFGHTIIQKNNTCRVFNKPEGIPQAFLCGSSCIYAGVWQGTITYWIYG